MPGRLNLNRAGGDKAHLARGVALAAQHVTRLNIAGAQRAGEAFAAVIVHIGEQRELAHQVRFLHRQIKMRAQIGLMAGGGQTLLDQLKKDESLPREVTTLLPISSASPKSKLQLRFMYDYIKEGECRDIIIDNMRGAIDPDSTLDLSGYDHFMAMPNLGVFKDSGFPFTRLADLSETVLVLPDTRDTCDFPSSRLLRLQDRTRAEGIATLERQRMIENVEDAHYGFLSVQKIQPCSGWVSANFSMVF